MTDFFDLGLSDILASYVSVEREKAANSLDAYKQSQLQASAIADAEKVTQTTETADLVDQLRFPSQLIPGVDNRLIYLVGFVGVLYMVMRKTK